MIFLRDIINNTREIKNHLSSFLCESEEVFTGNDILTKLRKLNSKFFTDNEIKNISTKNDETFLCFKLNGKKVGIKKSEDNRYILYVDGNIKRNIFVEDLIPTIQSMLSGVKTTNLLEYLPGELSANKSNKNPMTQNKKTKIGYNSDKIKTLATTISNSIKPLYGKPDVAKQTIGNMYDSFADFDKVTNSPTFTSQLRKENPKSLNMFKKTKNDVIKFKSKI